MLENVKLLNLSETSEDTNKTVYQGVMSIQIVTADCSGILNTVLTPPKEKPKWYDELNSYIDSAKVLSNKWIDDIAPNISSKIPTQVIEYSNVFEAIASEIIDMTKKYPDMKKGDKEFNQVNDLLNGLIDTIDNDILSEIDNSANELKKWGDEFQDVHDKIASKTIDIQSSEIEYQGEIEKLNADIKVLQTKVDNFNKGVMAGEISVGVGLFVAVAGIGICIVNPVAGGITIGVGALLVGGGAVTWGVLQKEINDAYDEITEDRKKIAQEKQLLSSVSSLEIITNSVLTAIEDATNHLSNVRTMWAGFENLVKGTISELNKAEAGATAILKKVFTDAAVKQWQDVEEYAMDIAQMKIETIDEGIIS